MLTTLYFYILFWYIMTLWLLRYEKPENLLEVLIIFVMIPILWIVIPFYIMYNYLDKDKKIIKLLNKKLF